MGTISSGIGLISGMDIESIVTQLMAIESRSRDQVEARKESLTVEQTAIMQLQARVMAVQLAATNFNTESVFQQKSVSSSNEDVLKVTAGKNAVAGMYSFVVKQLASNHQMVTGGYSSLGSGVGSGMVTIELGNGHLGRPTDLGMINGQQGFRHGKIEITDRAGNTAEIDLTMTLTMQDVIDEINADSTINVQARVEGDRLVLSDTVGGTGSLVVEEVGLGHAAEDLGILNSVAGTVTDGEITGRNVMSVTSDTLLSMLNDGNGIRGMNMVGTDLKFTRVDGRVFEVDFKDTLHDTIGDDDASNSLASLNSGAGVRLGKFKITDRKGHEVEIDLTVLGDSPTIGNVRTYIQDQASAAGLDITVNFNSRDHIVLKDNSDPTMVDGEAEYKSNFIVEDMDGGFAAHDLGIVGDVNSNTITGDQIWKMETLGDVVNAINNHWDNADGGLVVSINDANTGLNVVDMSGTSGQFAIEAGSSGSLAGEDLGLFTDASDTSHYSEFGSWQGRRLIGGLNSVLLRSLNGGSGGDPASGDYGADRVTAGGVINLTDRAGNNVTLNLDGPDARDMTVQDVIDAINNAGTNIEASLNDVGNGIVLNDTTEAPVNNMVVAGSLAEMLNIVVDDTVGSVNSGNLQLQYISGGSELDDMLYGKGIDRGQFKITDGDGNTAEIDLAKDSIVTLDDVIDEINSRTNIRASINENGDGLILVDDTSTGGLAIKVEDVDGTSAADLRIAGTATSPSNVIDGSFELSLDIGGGDDIESIMSRINAADIGVKASIINDGSGSNPYRLSLNSEISGRAGVVYLDAGSTTLNAQTLAEAKDAIVFMGGGSSDSPLLVTSNTNTIEDVVKGTTLELYGTSDTAVTVEIDDDIEGITAQVQGFVDAYNEAMDDLDELMKFDPNTYERGILFSDHTANSIKRQLQSLVQQTFAGLSSDANSLSDIGVEFGSLSMQTDGEGGSYAIASTPKLVFDEDVFRSAFAADPDAVAELFTKEDTGIGDYFEEKLDALAGSSESTIKSRLDAMTRQQRLFDDRIEHLDELLTMKETRLYNQYYAMERALAEMQSQQTALSSLSSMATSS